MTTRLHIFLLRALPPLLVLSFMISACAPRLRTAAWVVRFDLESPAEVTAVCREAKEAGVDELLVQVRGRADALYQSDLAPRAENLAQAPADFDPLKQLIADCAPLPLHAWLNVYYLWGGATPPDNPEHAGHPTRPWILSDNNGRPVSSYSEQERRLGWIEGSYADPASPEYRTLFVQVVKELLSRYPVAGIHLDFMRYPGPGYGKNEFLSKEFAHLWGIDPRLLPERLSAESVIAWLDGTQPPADRVLTTAALFWNEFRAGQVTQLLREVRLAVDQHAPPKTALSVAVFPEPAAAYLENGQEWQAWAAEGLVDSLYPMAYFGDSDRVDNQLREIAAHTPRSQNVALWAGLRVSGRNPAELNKEARRAGEYGYEGVALFSVGPLLKRPPIRPWVDAVRAPRANQSSKDESPVWTGPLSTARFTLPTPNLMTLRTIVRKALGEAPPGNDLEDRLTQRLLEYEHAREQSIPQALLQLEIHPVTMPERLELGGIFRYASPMDSRARWQEQEALCEKARQRLLAGDDLAAVAREMSQDSSKTLAGQLAPRFLDPLDPQDQELAHLGPQEISRVMRVANGFWCYRLESRKNGKEATFAEIPWKAKSILFHQALTERMASGL